MKKRKIIYVDDSEMARRLCQLALGRLGDFDVSAFESIEDAIPEVQTETPDLLLLDYWIGEREGVEMLDELRRSYSAEELPVVFVTASSDEARRKELQKAGALDVIFKPYTPGELVARVRDVLAPSGNETGGSEKWTH